MRQRNQKVYYSILAICYLEVSPAGSTAPQSEHFSRVLQDLRMNPLQVLLWTTCLLSSCAAVAARPEDAGYIIRETVRGLLCALPRAIPLP